MTDDQRHADATRGEPRQTLGDILAAMRAGWRLGYQCSSGHEHDSAGDAHVCDHLTSLEARVRRLEEGRNGD